MTRKIERGTPLDEATTKGSLGYAMRQIRMAFYRQHRRGTPDDVYE